MGPFIVYKHTSPSNKQKTCKRWRGGIRKVITNVSSTSITAQNGYLYKQTSFENITFNTSELKNGESFMTLQSWDNGGGPSFTTTVASDIIIKGQIENKYTSELKCIFKWDNVLNILTFNIKDE